MDVLYNLYNKLRSRYIRLSRKGRNAWGKQMVNYLWNLELFYYIVLLFIIVSGFIDWYRMDRLIDNDLKVQYLTAVWSKISIGLILALYFFIYFRFNIYERVIEFMPFYVFVLIISISVYLVSRFIMFAVKSVLTRIYK
jgi:hypothetical protein